MTIQLLLLCHLFDININIDSKTLFHFLGLVKVFIVEKKRSEDQLQQINTDLQQTQVTEQHLDQLQVRICETIIITKINLYIDYY